MTHPRSPRWILLWACLLASLYLPTLATPFDFNDDGNLVYPAASMPAGRHLRQYWDSVIGEYHNLGLFRLVLLAHWEIEANLLGPSAFRWRLTRLLWAALAAAAMLTLMLELRIRPAAAVIATAIAMWAPEQSEVWIALTLSEGVAMPYALIGLICAVRAARCAPRAARGRFDGISPVPRAYWPRLDARTPLPRLFRLRSCCGWRPRVGICARLGGAMAGTPVSWR
jgi:hypothetical protein